MTTMFFVAIFAGMGIVNTTGSYLAPVLLVAGVFLGSALWWVVLTGGASLILAKFSTDHWRWINRISGTVLVGFGIVAFIGLF